MLSNVYSTNTKNVIINEDTFSRSDMMNSSIDTETVDETIEALKQQILAFFDKIKEEHDNHNILPSNIEIRLVIN